MIGKRILYVDPLKLVHRGVVVREDTQWVYVRADGYADGEQFRVKKALAAKMTE